MKFIATGMLAGNIVPNNRNTSLVRNCLVVVHYTARNIMAEEGWKFKDKQDEERIDFDARDNDHGTFLVCKCCTERKKIKFIFKCRMCLRS